MRAESVNLDEEHLRDRGIQHQGGLLHALLQQLLHLLGILGQADADAQADPGDGV